MNVLAVVLWIDEGPGRPEGAEKLLAETEQRISEWTRLGRGLCGAFLDAAATEPPA
jgi:hypothetical protein